MVIPERPTIQALTIFAEVAKHGTMTAAAEAAGISQPAISAQVKALERFYSTRLLERDGRGSAPTAAGRLVTDYAVRVLALVDELGRGLADLEGLTAGELIVGASSTVGEQLLPTYLGQFHAAHPQVRLPVRIGNSADISARVAARELDFAIVGEESSDGDLLAEPVLEDQIVAFVAPEDPLLGEVPVAPLAL